MNAAARAARAVVASRMGAVLIVAGSATGRAAGNRPLGSDPRCGSLRRLGLRCFEPPDEGVRRRMSESGPSVWTGRALQAENDDLEKVGLALLYPAY